MLVLRSLLRGWKLSDLLEDFFLHERAQKWKWNLCIISSWVSRNYILEVLHLVQDHGELVNWADKGQKVFFYFLSSSKMILPQSNEILFLVHLLSPQALCTAAQKNFSSGSEVSECSYMYNNYIACYLQKFLDLQGSMKVFPKSSYVMKSWLYLFGSQLFFLIFQQWLWKNWTFPRKQWLSNISNSVQISNKILFYFEWNVGAQRKTKYKSNFSLPFFCFVFSLILYWLKAKHQQQLC